MIPRIITDHSITFIAKGRPWTLSYDHPSFQNILTLLGRDDTEEDEVIRLTDVRIAVKDSTDGHAVLTEDGLYLDGEQLPTKWAEKALADPDSMRVLLVSPGDIVRVEGDEDAPDGLYEVGDIDNDDVEKRVMLTSDEDYFGFVANTSIKEIITKAGE